MDIRKMTLFQDVNGRYSSKRSAGFIGLFISIAISFYGISSGDPEIMVNTLAFINPWLIFTGACFGVTVFEKPALSIHNTPEGR